MIGSPANLRQNRLFRRGEPKRFLGQAVNVASRLELGPSGEQGSCT